MGWRGLLLLVAVAGVLAAALWWTGRQPQDPGTLSVPALEDRRLLEARRVTIVTQHGLQPIELENDGGRWHVVEPLRDLASEAVLTSIADAWDTARLLPFTGVDVDAAWLAANGFAPWTARLEAEWVDGARLAFELGGVGLGDEVFVRKGGRVWRAGLALRSVLQGTPDDFREHVVFQNEGMQVRRVTIQRRLPGGGEDVTTLAQEHGREWLLEQPLRARAEGSAAAALAATIVALRADRFLTGNLTANPAELPDFVVTVEGDAGREVVELWRSETGFRGFHQPRQLEFGLENQRYATLLTLPVQELRSRMLLPAPVESLVRIAVRGPGTDEVRFERGAAEWALAEPIRFECEPTPVNELLSALRNLYAQEFVAADAVQAKWFERPWTVALTDQFRSAPVELLLGAEDPANPQLVFARRADETWVVKVPRPAADALRRPWHTYPSRKLRANVPPDVTRVALRNGAAGPLEFQRVGGRWQRAGGGASVGVLAELLEELRDGKAVAVHDARGLPASEFVLTLARENGDECERVELFEADGGLRLRFPRREKAVAYEVRAMLGKPLLELAGR